MDISILSKNSIRIRSKHAALVVDPTEDLAKTNADGIILLSNSNFDIGRILDYRIVIEGAGEYEVGGVKISVENRGEGFVYSLLVDGIKIVLGKISVIGKIQDSANACDIALLNADSDLKTTITSLEPKVVILYGDKKLDGVKLLGKEGIPAVQKFTITKDKLPTEMEVILLASS